MDLLVVDTLEADVLEWLGLRHSIRHAPELAHAPREFRRSLYNVRATIVPASVTIDAETLDFAPVLRAIGRVSAGAENIDLAACERRQIEIVRSHTASARAEAEFAIGAALSLLRRVPVRNADGSVAGRELGGATVGLVGMSPTARSIAQLLSGFGARVIGYDPALHASDSVWQLWKVAPVGLRELFERCRRRLRAARLLQPLPRPARRPLPHPLQAEPGAGEHRAFRPVRRDRAGGGAEERADRRRLARQPRARRARSRSGRCTASRRCR